MEHEIKEASGAIIVCIKGDVDLESSPQARKILMDCVNRKQPLLVDLSAAGYIDSSGVASLIEALQTARKNGTTLALAQASESVLRVLKLARLDKIFTIYETIEDGLNDIS